MSRTTTTEPTEPNETAEPTETRRGGTTVSLSTVRPAAGPAAVHEPATRIHEFMLAAARTAPDSPAAWEAYSTAPHAC